MRILIISREHESSLRKEKEEVFTLNRENQSLLSDLRNVSSIEESLKVEMLELQRKRGELEDIIQEMKAKICDDSM
jgi:chromosome segregation ATPase